jgi:PKD repeat protein
VTAWSWAFGDGNTSTDRNATHTYAAPGLYNVTLNASNPYGYNLSTRTAYIDVGNPPAAGFTTNVTGGNAPQAVQFTDTTENTPTSWNWTFGDGSFSEDQHPVHTYTAAGTYTVSLTATNAYGEDTETKTDLITILTAPGASFTQNVTAGNAPLAVQFTDTSTGNVTGWAWDFGDGNTSTDRNATHTYAAPGTYTVTLNASNPYGYDLSTQTDLVTVLAPPAASFTQNVTAGNAPLAVAFTDASTGNVTAWAWDFGDGNTSTDRNATHTYAAPGLYSVTLNASNPYGYSISAATAISVLDPPVANFSANATVIPVGAAVQFTDASTGDITGWSWTFGDGETSTTQSPAHTYGAAGTYTVTLTVSNAYGGDTETKTGYIDVGLPPAAAFTQNATEGNAPLTVQFTDTTANTPTAWLWTFGDGETSTQQNPQHTYAEPGTYTVTLTATNAYGEDTETKTDLITALGPPAAAFTTDVTGGNAPLTVQFTDTSTGDITGWSWTFGDGETSTAQSPSHTYAEPGTYTVSLTVSNAYSEDTETKTDLITVLTPPAAAFSADLTLIPVGGTVQFTDASTGDITGWSWAFGDGETSTAQSPSHTYATAGLQTVSLTVSNAYGSDTETKAAYIDVGHPPVADFSPSATIGVVPAAITFTDTSANTPTAWLWAFGDGNTSTLQNPSHTYVTAGTYEVTLTATNAYGEDTETKTALLTVYDPVTANFTVDTTAGLVPLAVTFTDTSTGDPTEWTWAFGDGETSTLQNPAHTYSAEGNYTITLTASNPGDEDAETKTEYIKVFDPVAAAFTVDETLGLTPMTVQFTDTSTGTPAAWTWDFGDGTTSTDQNPSHTYAEPGLYTVSLTVEDGFIGANPPLASDIETKTGLIAAYDPLVPGFSASPVTGSVPLTVQFTDTTTGAPTAWSWTFGDGATSTQQHPVHTYTTPGYYTVTLTVSHAADEQTETKAAYITADYEFTAAFTQNISYGMVPLAVQFTDTTDTSVATPTGYLWTFGDGATSTQQHPVHTYTTPGYYTVTLTVYGVGTENTATHPSAVHAGILPTVAFTGTPTSGTAPLTVQFTSTCSDTTSYLWAFGDGSTSTAQNPSHTYTTPGTYTVTLTGTNIYGSTVSTRADYVTATQVPPVASFTAAPTSGHAPVPVRFTDTSTNAPTAWHWDFGDGETSTSRNPTHIYRAAGTYTVSLTVTNSGGSDTETKTDLLTIYAAGDPGYTDRFPASDKVVTLDATGLGTQEAVLNGELAAATDTEVWFEYGTKSNSYGFKTEPVTAEPGSLIQTPLKRFPLIAGQTYYYRAACADGYGAEKTFTLPTLSPHPTTTYGAAADQFLYSFEDGDTMIQDMTEATWSPYVATLGALFFGLVIGAIFINLAMKGHSIAIPAVLVMVIGGSLWAFVPPEFIIIAQAFVILGIGGLIYYIYTKRKL